MGITDQVLDTQLTPEQREYLEPVNLLYDLMIIVIKNILDFSKIEAGKFDWR